MDDQPLLGFFKALADANRLKIVGLLAKEDFTVEQLAAMLGLRPSTISHHLSRLAKAGLVSARAEGYYNLYRLETSKLETMARQLLSRETLPAVAADVDLKAYDRKVLSDFSNPDGSLKIIPAQRKKLTIILRHIAKSFEPEVRYLEKEVNQILARFHEDTATLRRELVGAGLLERHRGEYWRP
ncbi:MAG: ArsR family transcriptional regulator [Anaerolineae bacterium SM23_ 63]|nr:MAG: ArsR family transcriptional regulator [Anaerolineae bacterium SM23_ 63]HEY46333.1 metalloregulator ArsR/SmtB family transcription factor [Anaerolineae bacterium]